MNFKGIPPMTGSLDSLRTLDNIEKDLCNALQSAGQAIQELSKDKPSMKQVETHSNAFLKTLQTVESNISQQILHLNQVSTGQAHEGSIYASQKVLNMAWHRFEHVKSKLNELEKARSSEIFPPPQQLTPQSQQQAPQPPQPPPQQQPASQPQQQMQQLQQQRQQQLQQQQQQQQQQQLQHHLQQQQHLQMQPK